MADSFFDLVQGIILNSQMTNIERDIVGNDTVDKYLIDTQFTADFGYETAISYDKHPWIIVERYADREKAQAGHLQWVERCKKHQEEFYSVQLDVMISIYEE